MEIKTENINTWTPIRMWDWQELATRFEPMAHRVGIGYSDMRLMINPFMVIASQCMCIDITKFWNWVETHYPEYKSVEQFLLAKDPENIEIWKHIFGIEVDRDGLP